ncbi:MAG: hypothetical protein A2901_05820 [Elusimicrobia bacterium RIFCSPLOWO2_01_FULL_54_10]|nr:MAG: hypothetical protein A2901_05820 [Elusimicrobia bacterium RIFCSPLOWO2_01_FULL_54_10]
MHWMVWAASHLWTYYEDKRKARVLWNLRHTVAGVGFTLLSFAIGFCALGLLLLSSFFFFLEQSRFSLAALWTALICSAFALAAGYFGFRFFNRSVKV